MRGGVRRAGSANAGPRLGDYGCAKRKVMLHTKISSSRRLSVRLGRVSGKPGCH